MRVFTVEEIAKKIKIGRPIRKSKLIQDFGKPLTDTLAKKYKEFGLVDQNGEPFHNGQDFGGTLGQMTYCVFPATVNWVGNGSKSAGNYVSYITDAIEIDNCKIKLEFRHLHFDKNILKIGQRIELGQDVGPMDSTGYSFGDHLHFDVSELVEHSMIKDMFVRAPNGTCGFINPTKLYADVRWNELPVDEHYGKTRNWTLEYTFKFANNPVGSFLTDFLLSRIKAARYVHRKLIAMKRNTPFLTSRELNAIIYGSWDLESVLDPAMFALWGWYTKGEVEDAKKRGIYLSTPLICG